MSSAVAPPADSRLPSLDGGRGLLALVVMFAHVAALAGLPQGLILARMSVLGFFLISAYALTVSWRPGYVAFVAKRFLRLWPAYAAALAIGAALTGIPLPWHDYFWVPFRPADADFPQDPVVWSLYTEVYASLAMPVFVMAARRTDATVALSALLIALALWRRDFAFGLLFAAGAWAAMRWRFDVVWLNRRTPQALGRISYSLYLIHAPVIVTLRHFAPGFWIWIAVPAAFAAAVLFHRVLEQPSIEASRWVGQRLGARRNEDQSAVGSLRMTNSIWPSASSRQNSISVR